MAIDSELLGFVREALARGMPRSQIEEVLLRAGWEPAQVRSALSSFAEVDFPVPVPRPKAYLSARESFLYLLLFTLLYVTACNLGSLIFQFINWAFPDPGEPMGFQADTREAIRWAVASLLIAFPIFLYLSRLVRREIRRDPEKRHSRVRKWLTYMTLFIAAAVIVGDLTALVYSFLGGELTVRSVLKVATVGAIAGAVFGYYLWDVRGEERGSP